MNPAKIDSFSDAHYGKDGKDGKVAPATKRAIQRAALLDSCADASVLLPVAAGGTGLLAAFALSSSSPWLWLGGLAAVGVGGLMAAWRLVKRYPAG